jgi:hypothetical protein
MHQVLDTTLGPEPLHVALLGSGGIGKSSFAKAIINEPRIKEKFKDRRFFIRFDDILASQITYSTFTDRVARTLGLASTGDHVSILENLEREDILLVFDNAETFLDSKASQDVSRIKHAMNEFGAFPSVSIILTSRSKDIPHGLRCAKVEVPTLDAIAACEVFAAVYGQDVSSSQGILKGILSAVEYHPLTITLLAHVAEVNGWTIPVLNRHWEVKRTQILNHGSGKDENLSDSIELSLGSPSIQSYGDDVQRVLRIIAFFPQGVLQSKLRGFFPSIPRVEEIINVLQRQSLLLLNEEFVTMLVPIRLYICDTLRNPGDSLLEAARRYYYAGIERLSEQAKRLIEIEDVNIESLLTSDLQTFSGNNLVIVMNVCGAFIQCLGEYKPRPTSLRSLIYAVDTSRSRTMARRKIRCFHALSSIARQQSSFIEALELYQITHDLALASGDQQQVLRCRLAMANTRVKLGQYGAAQQLLQRAQESEAWSEIAPQGKGRALSYLGRVKECTDDTVTGVSLALLFQESQQCLETAKDAWDANFAMAEGAFAFSLIDCDTESTQAALDKAHLLLKGEQKDKWSAPSLFLYLAATASSRGEVEEAKKLLTLSRHSFVANNRLSRGTRVLLDLAIFAASRGDVDEARNFIKEVDEESKAHAFISHEYRWLSLYTSGVIELASERLSEASEYFQEAKKHCEAQQEFQIRAFSSRALGELAYMQKKITAAREYFEETKAICGDAGIVPSLLYRRSTLTFFSNAPPATCEGWPLFLQGDFPSE